MIIVRLIAAIALVFSFYAAALGQSTGGTSFIQMVGQLESGGNANPLSATNPNSTSTGMYQDTQAALAQAGILTINSPPGPAQYGANGDWSNVTFRPNSYGITSRQDLMNASPQVQTAIENSYLSSVWQQDQSQGLTSYVGQSVNGQEINQSAILGCSEYLGTTGCSQYLSTGSAGSLTAGAEQLISQYSQADSSSITGQQGVQVAQTLPGVSAGQEDLAGAGAYCDTTVGQALSAVAQKEVQAETNLAENPQTGYSLPNGSGILNPSGSFGQYSCLSNIFNNGLNVVFQVPSLSQILSELENAACTAVDGAIQQSLAPLSQSLFQNVGADGFSAGALGASIGTTNTPGVSGYVESPTSNFSLGTYSPVGSGLGVPVSYGGAY